MAFCVKSDQLFIFKIHFFDDGKHRIVDMALFFFVKLFHIDGLAVFYDNMSLSDPGKMLFPDVTGVVDAYGNDGTAGLLCNFKAAAMERQKFVRFHAAASLGEDADGDAGFYLFHRFENGFHSLLDVLSVKEEAVQIFHPVGQKRHF